MQTPTFAATDGYEAYFPQRTALTKTKLQEMLNIPGVPNSCALWNGHEFEIGTFSVVSTGTPRVGSNWHFEMQPPKMPGGLSDVIETAMHLYYPVDPRTNLKDWKRATVVKENADNTAWLPYHCDVDHMLDREVEIRSAVVAAFAVGIDKLQQACNLQLALLARNPTDSSAGSREQAARLKHIKLIEFRNNVLAHVIMEARKRYLGWYHQNPDESHIHNIVHDAVTTLYHANSDDFLVVQREIMNAAFTVHAYETRWDQVARLKKEKEAADAAANAANQQNQNQDNQ